MAVAALVCGVVVVVVIALALGFGMGPMAYRRLRARRAAAPSGRRPPTRAGPNRATGAKKPKKPKKHQKKR